MKPQPTISARTARPATRSKRATPNRNQPLTLPLVYRLMSIALVFAATLSCSRTPPPTETVSAPSSGTTTAASGSLAAISGTPGPTPTPAPYVHFVEAGETLDHIAATLGCSAEDIVEANPLDNPDALQIGQRLILPELDLASGPSTLILPDSEFVYGPTYVNFDVESFCASRPGYLNDYEELVDGENLTGPQIVELISWRYSIGPRVLLAMIEFQSGWVDNPNPVGWALENPLGATEEYQAGLLYQLAWAADQMNKGYYDWKGRGREILYLLEGKSAQYNSRINAGTAAIQYFLAYNATWEEWHVISGEGPNSFLATYRGLFGDPSERDLGLTVPTSLQQPDLCLPWERGQTWYYTGGPHGGWNDGSGWAAVDFIPPGQLGCQMAPDWTVAAASGLVVRSEDGVVVIDVDGDGREETGWNLFYMHVAAEDRVPVGTIVDQGQRIGHPSCEGGYSTATHLHFARKYDGEWLPADGSCPLVLSGWRAHASVPYEGAMTRGEELRTACECREDEINGLTAE